MRTASHEWCRDQRVECTAMTKAWRCGHEDGQDGGGAGTPRDVAHARSDDIGGGSCGIDQVKRGKRMQGASTAACNAGDEVGNSSTGLRGSGAHPRWSRRTWCGAIAAGAAATTSSHGGEGSPQWAASPQDAAHPVDSNITSLARSSLRNPVVRTPLAAAAWIWEKRGIEEEEEYDKWAQGNKYK
uniref:Uncharacterized protein n=1 Tax=Oryza rufipogon TaxID=4529 RepID=A0A0E0MWJ8_ORYRU